MSIAVPLITVTEPTAPTPNNTDEVTKEPGVGIIDDTPQGLANEINQSQRPGSL